MMRSPATLIRAASLVAVFAASLPFSATVAQAAAGSTSAEQGKTIAFDRKKGNCLACHQIAGGSLAGNIGPPLIAMQARFPDKSQLRAQIWDSTQANPNTMMPPFGRHKILTEGEIDKVVEFIYSL